MRCDRCHCNEAAILVDATVGEDTISVHLCQDCAQAEADGDSSGSPDLTGLLQSIAAKVLGMAAMSLPHGSDEVDGLTCATCGLTLADFRRRRRLGCETCYTITPGNVC